MLDAMLTDTDPRCEAVLLAAFRAMSPTEKLRRVEQMSNATLELAAARLRHQYGPMSERELRLRLAALWLDRESLKRATGWDPEEHGY